MRALVVEDEAALREGLRAQLVEQGFTVDIAADGNEGLFAGSEYPLDIAVIDLGLPKISGLEVLRQFRNNPSSSSIPVVVLTTSAEDRDIEEAYKLGCNSYIVKPVEFNKFMEVAAQIEVYWCLLNTTPRPV